MSVDYGPLLNPKKMPPFSRRATDFLSWCFPVIAAILGIGAGIEALRNYQIWSAVLAIIGAFVSLASIRFITWGTAIRDQQSAKNEALADMAAARLEHLERLQPPNC